MSVAEELLAEGASTEELRALRLPTGVGGDRSPPYALGLEILRRY